MPELLKQLKAGGYKVVHMKRAKTPIKTLAMYDEMLIKEAEAPDRRQRPTASVVRTVAE